MPVVRERVGCPLRGSRGLVASPPAEPAHPSPPMLVAGVGHTGTADHIMRETWLAESDGDRDPLPWANGHGSRLSEDEYDARSDDLAHNEGRERFHFDPRLEWPEDEG